MNPLHPRRIWTRLTCNWFAIGLHCATRGHQWRAESLGVVGLRITTCAWCGKYRGHSRTREDRRVFDVNVTFRSLTDSEKADLLSRVERS